MMPDTMKDDLSEMQRYRKSCETEDARKEASL